MKVLILTKHNVVRYGVAGAVQALCAYLPRHGFEACVFSSDDSADAADLPHGAPSQYGPLPKPGLFARRALGPIVDYCRTQGVELVHTQV